MSAALTIVEFLLARIAEVEIAAQQSLAALPGPYEVADRGWVARIYVGESTAPVLRIEQEETLNGDPGAVLNHIARHDPARVLAECAAKRAIIDAHRPDDDKCSVCSHEIGYSSDGAGGEFYETDRRGDDWPCATLRALTAVYANHPDYRQEWAL